MKLEEAIKQFEYRLAFHEYRNDVPEYFEAMQIAVESIKRQIPRRPEHAHHFGYCDYECPSCRMPIGMIPKDAEYCKSCGQAIDWSDWSD